jgi:hypothetical protein
MQHYTFPAAASLGATAWIAQYGRKSKVEQEPSQAREASRDSPNSSDEPPTFWPPKMPHTALCLPNGGIRILGAYSA